MALRATTVSVVSLALLLVTAGCSLGSDPGDTTKPSTPRGPATRCLSAGAQTDASLREPERMDLAWSLVSSAENSSLRWRDQFDYIEYNVEGNAKDNRGYTAGPVGFTSRTGDLRLLVEEHASNRPDSALASYVEALQRVDGTSSRDGLGEDFVSAWRQAAADPAFRQEQLDVATRLYIDPALTAAEDDELRALGQFAYVDAMIMHGPGSDPQGFPAIRRAAAATTPPPAEGGEESLYLDAFLDARAEAMRSEQSHRDTSRVDDAQRRFLRNGNLDLELPLTWQVYGDAYQLLPPDDPRCEDGERSWPDGDGDTVDEQFSAEP